MIVDGTQNFNKVQLISGCHTWKPAIAQRDSVMLPKNRVVFTSKVLKGDVPIRIYFYIMTTLFKCDCSDIYIRPRFTRDLGERISHYIHFNLFIKQVLETLTCYFAITNNKLMQPSFFSRQVSRTIPSFCIGRIITKLCLMPNVMTVRMYVSIQLRIFVVVVVVVVGGGGGVVVVLLLLFVLLFI